MTDIRDIRRDWDSSRGNGYATGMDAAERLIAHLTKQVEDLREENARLRSEIF